MDLSPYLENLRQDLHAVAAPAGAEVARAAELLTGSLEAAARLRLLEALADAAAEITTELDGASVEVRLRGRDAQFVVSGPAPATSPIPTPVDVSGDAGDLTRITLRVPEGLKDAVERAAAAESISVNAWLVRAIAQVVTGTTPGTTAGPTSGPTSGPDLKPGRGRLGRRVTGFAQS